MPDLLRALSKSSEFESFVSSKKERKELNEQNLLNEFILPKKKTIDTYDKKIHVLMQVIWNRRKLASWELNNQLKQIKNTALRILYFYKKYFVLKKNCRALLQTQLAIKYTK